MTLVDQYGKEIKAHRPITDEIAVQSIRDRYISYPSHGLTPEKLATLLKEADQGDVFRQSELFEEMEEKDLHLGGILQTRKLAVSGLSWEVLPASDSAEDQRIASAAKEMLEYIENWEDALLDILDAIGKGFSVQEIMWQFSEKSWWIKTLNYVHPKRFTFTGPPTAIGGQTINPLLQVPRLITDEVQIYGEELLPNKFVFHKYKARSGATSRGGLCRPCSYMYLFKNYDIKDWLIFNELFSVPMRVGKYKAGATKDEIDKLKQAVFNLGVDAAAVVSDSTIIEILESKVRGKTSTFKDLAEFCEAGMSKAVLGHTGSSDSTPGKLGSEDAANEVRQDLLEADSKALEKTIKFQLLAPWTAYNFGPDKGVPKFKLHYETGEDLEKTAKVYGILVKDVNFKGIPVKHVHERFGIPEPEEGDETVSAAPTASSFGLQNNEDVVANGIRPGKKGADHTPLQNKCTCGRNHELMINSDKNADQQWVDEYIARMQGSLAEVKGKALDEITSWLKSQSSAPTEAEFTSKIQNILTATYGTINTSETGDVIASMYQAFVVNAAISGPDVRAINFLEKLDNFYLSKYIRNPDSVLAVRNFLSEHYLKNASGLFGRTSEESIQRFRDLFSQKLTDLTDGQIQRIIDTSVQRTRNWSHLQQMHETGLAEIEIYEPTQDCDFCKTIHGKIIRVDTAHNRMTEISGMSPEEYEASFKVQGNQPTLDNIEGFVARGELPPYHPHCHGRIIKRIRK